MKQFPGPRFGLRADNVPIIGKPNRSPHVNKYKSLFMLRAINELLKSRRVTVANRSLKQYPTVVWFFEGV